MDNMLYRLCLIAITVVSITIAAGTSFGFGFSSNDQRSRIAKLENRIMELECRHVRFEDGSTTHGDANRTAECVYTLGK